MLTKGSPTSETIAGFLGFSDAGPFDITRVNDYNEYVHIYGEPNSEFFLAPAVKGFFANGGSVCYVGRVPDDFSTNMVSAFSGNGRKNQGLAAMMQHEAVTLLAAPDARNPLLSLQSRDAITDHIVSACEAAKNTFAIIDIDRNPGTISDYSLSFNSPYCAVYYPWLSVGDGNENSLNIVPPSGHISGLLCKIDRNKGLHKTSANQLLHDVLGVDKQLFEQERRYLKKIHINPISDFQYTNQGVRTWGAETTGASVEFRYIQDIRVSIQIKNTIQAFINQIYIPAKSSHALNLLKEKISSFLIEIEHARSINRLNSNNCATLHFDVSDIDKELQKNNRASFSIEIIPGNASQPVSLSFTLTL